MKKLRIDLDMTDWKGQWALVTGASSGIGREFSLQLAAKGLNVALLARREARLKALAQEIETRFGVRTLVIVSDLADPSAAQGVKDALETADVRVRLLVNNAAFGRWGRVELHAPELYQAMIQVDVAAPTRLALEFFPHLASLAPSALIMLSSPAALQPVPYMAVYAAAKAYIHALGQALYGEWSERGILVQTLVPGPTATEFDEIAGAYDSAIQKRGRAEEVVRASLRALAAGEPVVWQARNTLAQRLFALLPAPWVLRKVARMFAPPDQQARAGGKS